VTEDQERSRSLLWRQLDEPGMEHCELRSTRDGRTLCRGTLVLVLNDAPAQVSYSLRCDGDWATQWVGAWMTLGDIRQAVALEVDRERRWWTWRYYDTPRFHRTPAAEVVALRGLVDVDLSVTPLTNTLPIRRLKLKVGESAEVTAAWLRFPELTVEPLPQRYTRLGDRLFRYESNGGDFVADLEVDEIGLVTRYGNLWERVGIGDG
jgi:hypothetical protein